MKAREFEFIFQVAWADTDAAAIVYYPNFFKWMDQATAELFKSIGLPLSELFNQDIGVPLVEAKCQFRRPAKFEDEIRIVSRPAILSEKSIKIEHKVYHQDTLIAEGYEVRVTVRINNGNIVSVQMPARLRNLLLGGDVG
ncbi:acyl-CoA thioesterase [Alicyclobacillus kakegawensis]|uniref:acyl-CoA thioesterase n=1 Tax=Alicyclobacillus kakegawensis TaxID=392012 RepID=UPI000833E512|nr:thioesterase family protein [Alicyclobacillus kakegawensis]